MLSQCALSLSVIVYVRHYTCKSIITQCSIAATGVLAGSWRVHRLQDCNPHPWTPLPMTLQGSPNPCPTLVELLSTPSFASHYHGHKYPPVPLHELAWVWAQVSPLVPRGLLPLQISTQCSHVGSNTEDLLMHSQQNENSVPAR